MTTLKNSSFGPANGVSRRALLGLLGVGAVGVGLSGCNFTNTSGGSAASGDFTFTYWGTGGEKEAVSKVINEFIKSKSLNPKPQSIPDQYETKLNTLLAANNAPDAGYLTESMAMRLGQEGKIESVLGRPGFDDILPQALHYWAPDKAVSQTAIESIVLWFDEKATTDSGVTPPASTSSAWAWDKFVEAAEKLTLDANGRRPSDSGFDAGNIKRYGVSTPALPAIVALLKSNGVELFDDAGTKTNLDTPEAIAVIQNIADLVFKHHVAPTPAQATTFGASTALLLTSGRVAMAMDGQWALLDLGQSKVKYNAAVLPKFQEKSYTTILAGANAVFAASKHQDLGFELLTQLADPEKVDLYSNGLWMPLMKKYYTDEAAINSWSKSSIHPSNYRTAVIDPVLGDTVAFPSYKIKNFTSVQTTLTNGLNPLFTEQSDVAAGCKRLAADVNKQLQGSYQDRA